MPPKKEHLHFKKDGTLDMRYRSSQLAAQMARTSLGSPRGSGRSGERLHLKKDGTLDMRYRSSFEAAGVPASARRRARGGEASAEAQSNIFSLPPEVPRKEDGTPDMRCRAAKEFVQRQAVAQPTGHTLPAWVPHLKDGAIDLQSAVGLTFLCARNKDLADERRHRDVYWERRLQEEAFLRVRAEQRARHVELQRAEDLQETAAMAELLEHLLNPAARVAIAARPPLPSAPTAAAHLPAAEAATVPLPRVPPPPEPEPVQSDPISISHCIATVAGSERQSQCATIDKAAEFELSGANASRIDQQMRESSLAHMCPSSIVRIAMEDLELDDDAIGSGGFGVVKRALWKKPADEKDECAASASEGTEVAVKLLHVEKFKKRGRSARAGVSELEHFRREMDVMAALGAHPNLVHLFGYVEEPAAIVMEMAALGSLSHLLYYADDDETEAAIFDGRVKRRLALGVATGMRQLHAAHVVHADLKPQNVLVTADWVAKVSDFGMSTFRAQSASLSTSRAMCADERADERGAIAGTAAYMAPELLQAGACASYESDVYAFGVLLNELVSEEEPYSEQARHVLGKGAFGAAMHAAQGNRPAVRVPPKLLDDNSGQEASATPLVALVQQCWHSEARVRPTFKQCVERISADDFFVPNSEQMASCYICRCMITEY